MSADLSCCVIWSVPRSLIPFFFFTPTATTEIYTLSLHDALPICRRPPLPGPLLQWTRREERGAVVENHLGSRDKSLKEQSQAKEGQKPGSHEQVSFPCGDEIHQHNSGEQARYATPDVPLRREVGRVQA